MPADNGFRVWWPTGNEARQASAEGFAATLGSEEVARLVAFMGPQLVPDGDEKCGGSDSRVDVYVEPLKLGGGITTPLRSRASEHCPALATYVVMDPRATRSIVVHEVMHVLQWTHPRTSRCVDWSYLDEATAVWAENFVWPNDDNEHSYTQLVQQPERSFYVGGEWPDGGYEAWAFFYAATRGTSGGPGLVPSLYAAGRTAPPLVALDTAFAKIGGLRGRWSAFAREAWNRPLLPDALSESFFNWDFWGAQPEVTHSSFASPGPARWSPSPWRSRHSGECRRVPMSARCCGVPACGDCRRLARRVTARGDRGLRW